MHINNILTLFSHIEITRIELKRRLSDDLDLLAKEKLESIQRKLSFASALRESKISALQNRLKEHVLLHEFECCMKFCMFCL